MTGPRRKVQRNVPALVAPGFFGNCSAAAPGAVLPSFHPWSRPGVALPPPSLSRFPRHLYVPVHRVRRRPCGGKVSVSAAASTTMTSRGPNFPGGFPAPTGFRSGFAPRAAVDARRTLVEADLGQPGRDAFGVSSRPCRALSAARADTALAAPRCGQLFAPERVEHHDVVNAVDELGRKWRPTVSSTVAFMRS